MIGTMVVKMTRIMLLAILLLGVSSCTTWMTGKPELIDDFNFTHRFPDNKKAIVIMKDNQKIAGTRSIWQQVANPFKEVKKKRKLKKKKRRHRKKRKKRNRKKRSKEFTVGVARSGDYQIFMIKPGIYSLLSFGTNLNQHSSGSVVSSGSIYNDKTKEPEFALFEVKSGEVAYLGDIDFMYEEGASLGFWNPNRRALVNIGVTNNIAEAKKEFNMRYPELKDHKVVSRLIRNSQSYSKK